MENTNNRKVRSRPNSNQRKKSKSNEARVSILLLNQRGECLVTSSLFIGLITLVISFYVFIGNHFEKKTKTYLQEFQHEWQKLQTKYSSPTQDNPPDSHL